MQAESGRLGKTMTIYMENHPEVTMVVLDISANDWGHAKMLARLLDRLRIFGFVVTNIFPTAHFYRNNEKLTGSCSTVFSMTRLAKIQTRSRTSRAFAGKGPPSPSPHRTASTGDVASNVQLASANPLERMKS
jgi:hypothetical protein